MNLLLNAPRHNLILFLLLIVTFAQAQRKDSTLDLGKKYPNILKYSISSYALYPSSFHLGYERILNKNKSFYIFGAFNEFPVKLNVNLTNTNFTDSRNKSGFNIGGEFRFYLSQENKYNAPHGIYLAPYISFYQFGTENTLTHTDSARSQSVIVNSQISLFNVGLELGYQFVVFKRFVIDAEMFGPSLTTYSFQVKMNGELNGMDQIETLKAVLDALKAKFPLLNDISTSKEVYKSGVLTTKFPSAGFRYAVSIGFML